MEDVWACRFWRSIPRRIKRSFWNLPRTVRKQWKRNCCMSSMGGKAGRKIYVSFFPPRRLRSGRSPSACWQNGTMRNTIPLWPRHWKRKRTARSGRCWRRRCMSPVKETPEAERRSPVKIWWKNFTRAGKSAVWPGHMRRRFLWYIKRAGRKRGKSICRQFSSVTPGWAPAA